MNSIYRKIGNESAAHFEVVLSPSSAHPHILKTLKKFLDIHRTMRVSLPEQVWIDLEPASFGSRGLAYVFDFLIRWTFVLLVFYLLIVVSGFVNAGLSKLLLSGLKSFKQANQIFLALFIIFIFLIEFSYPIFFEVFRDGVTPGKKLLGLRVVDERGLPITLRASFLRTILIFVDFIPIAGFTAFLSMMISKNSQRLGDLVARTMVVHQLDNPKEAIEVEQGSTETQDIISLELYNILERYLKRKDSLTEDTRIKACSSLIQELPASFEAPQSLSYSDLNTKEEYLQKIFSRVRPARVNSSGQSSNRQENWRQIKQELRDINQEFENLEDTTKSYSASELFNVAENYQRLCQRYGYLSTFYPDTAEASEASRLVRFGRRLIYGRRLKYVEGV